MRPPDLTARQLRPERMDDPGLPEAAHRRALRGLGRLHVVSRSAAQLWGPIEQVAQQVETRPLRLVDWACGGGDVLIALARRARRAGLAIDAEGRDVSERAVRWAREAAAAAGVSDCVRFRCVDCVEAAHADVASDAMADVAISSLFMHHLESDDVRDVLAAMKRSVSSGVVVQDLVRSASGWRWAWLGSRAVPTCDVVRTDALLSVSNAFTPQEFAALAADAGLDGARVEVCWPQRMTCTWTRPR